MSQNNEIWFSSSNNLKMSTNSELKLPQIGHPIVQGAYGRKGRDRIIEHQKDLISKAKGMNYLAIYFVKVDNFKLILESS